MAPARLWRAVLGVGLQVADEDGIQGGAVLTGARFRAGYEIAREPAEGVGGHLVGRQRVDAVGDGRQHRGIDVLVARLAERVHLVAAPVGGDVDPEPDRIGTEVADGGGEVAGGGDGLCHGALSSWFGAGVMPADKNHYTCKHASMSRGIFREGRADRGSDPRSGEGVRSLRDGLTRITTRTSPVQLRITTRFPGFHGQHG